MGNLIWIFIAVPIAISFISVIFCIVRGKGVSHKMLIFLISLLGAVAVICFGGQAILTCFDMGWRCTPFNTMIMLCVILSIYILACCMGNFILSENANPALIGCGCISMLLAIFITLMSAFLYFNAFCWHDGLATYNDQTIVYANDQHGGSCSWRYYTHVNDLVRGVEITQDGWRGYPPFK